MNESVNANRVEINERVLITIRRPAGNIEQIENNNMMLMTERVQKIAIDANRKAGKGEIVKFERIFDEAKMTDIYSEDEQLDDIRYRRITNFDS